MRAAGLTLEPWHSPPLPHSFPALALADRVSCGLKLSHSSSPHTHMLKPLGRKKFCFCSGSLHDFLFRTQASIAQAYKLGTIPPSKRVTWCATTWSMAYLVPLYQCFPIFLMGLANSVMAAVSCYLIILERIALGCLLYHISALADAWQWLSYLSGGKVGSLLLPWLSPSTLSQWVCRCRHRHLLSPASYSRQKYESYMAQVSMPAPNLHLNLIRGGYWSLGH